MLNKLNELRKGKEEGFTLIELLVVILIIGVLSAIALPIFLNQQKEAVNAGVKSDVRNTVTNVSTYLVSNPTATDLGAKVSTTVPAPVGSFNIVKTGSTESVVVDGDYDAWTVVGTAPGGSGAFTYTFSSATGQYS